jgi:hypothetical protein
LLHDVLTESAELKQNRDKIQKNIFSQIQNVKAFLREEKKRKHNGAGKQAREGGGGPGPGAGAESETEVASAVFADIFLQLRDALSAYRQELQGEERAGAAEVAAARRQLVAAAAAHNSQVAALSQLEQFGGLEEDGLEVRLLREEWQRRLQDVDRSLEAALGVARDEWAAACEAQFGCDPCSASGAWGAEEHTTFAKIYAQFRNTGMSRQRMAVQLAAELPDTSPLEVSLHEDWYVRYKSYHKRHKDIVAAHSLTERQALMAKGKEALDQCRARCQEAEALERDLEEREGMREQLHRTLSEQRRTRDAAEGEKRQGELLALRELRGAEEARQAARQRDAARKKALLGEYRRERAQEDERLQLDRAEQQRMQDELRRQKVDAERGNVDMRNELVQQRLAEKRRKEEDFLRREERVTELLLRLATQVPYYDKIQNAESKLDHVTASVRAHEYQGFEEEERGHMSLKGFTDKGKPPIMTIRHIYTVYIHPALYALPFVSYLLFSSLACVICMVCIVFIILTGLLCVSRVLYNIYKCMCMCALHVYACFACVPCAALSHLQGRALPHGPGPARGGRAPVRGGAAAGAGHAPAHTGALLIGIVLPMVANSNDKLTR